MTNTDLSEYITRYHKTDAAFLRYFEQLKNEGKISKSEKMDRSKLSRRKATGLHSINHVDGEFKQWVEVKISTL